MPSQRGEKKFQNIFQFQQKTDCESRWEEDGYGGKKWVEVATISFLFIINMIHPNPNPNPNGGNDQFCIYPFLLLGS